MVTKLVAAGVAALLVAWGAHSYEQARRGGHKPDVAFAKAAQAFLWASFGVVLVAAVVAFARAVLG